MITVIFLTHRFFHLYNFKALRKLPNVRLVTIISEPAVGEIDSLTKQYFHAVYINDKPSTKRFTSPIAVEYAESCVLAEQAISQESTIHIICNDDISMLLAAHLRKKFKLPGMLAHEILPFCDKLICKDILSKNKVRLPQYAALDVNKLQIDTKRYFQELQQHFSLPFILKPKNAAASKGVKKICSFEEFKQFKSENDVDFASYEVEEYIQGEMYHCDSIIAERKIIFSECSKYNYPMGEFLEGRNIASLPLNNTNPLRLKILSFANSVLKALSYPEGATHMELFVTDKQEIVFLEIAARCPGGLAVPVYKKTFNVDMLEADLKIKLGLTLQLNPKQSHYSFWVLTPLYDGVVTQLNPAPIKSEHQIYWKVKEGQHYKSSQSLGEVSTMLWAWSNNYNILEEDYKKINSYEPVTYSNCEL